MLFFTPIGWIFHILEPLGYLLKDSLLSWRTLTVLMSGVLLSGIVSMVHQLLSGSTKEEWNKYEKIYVTVGGWIGFITGFIWSLTYQFSTQFTRMISYWVSIFRISNIIEALTMPFGLFIVISFIGIFYGLIYPNKDRPLSSYVCPNQGIRNSWINAWFFFLIAISPLLISILVRSFFSTSPKDTLITEEIPFLFSELGTLATFGYVAWLIPGFACIQHFILRLILWKNSYIPWKYDKFLNYVNERLFLQKVGNGYVFIHRMLMEHFANMKLD